MGGKEKTGERKRPFAQRGVTICACGFVRVCGVVCSDISVSGKKRTWRPHPTFFLSLSLYGFIFLSQCDRKNEDMERLSKAHEALNDEVLKWKQQGKDSWPLCVLSVPFTSLHKFFLYILLKCTIFSALKLKEDVQRLEDQLLKQAEEKSTLLQLTR